MRTTATDPKSLRSAVSSRTQRQAGTVTAEYAMVAVGAVLFGALFLAVIRLPIVHTLMMRIFTQLLGFLFQLHIFG
jgi:Protein of unknown function (DUF4244)